MFDLDSVMLLRAARTLRDQAVFLSGRKLEQPPRPFLGATADPFVPAMDFRPLRLKQKLDAGADFVQTQYCFDVPRMKEDMKVVRDRALHEKVFTLVGVAPLRSAWAAGWMRANGPGAVNPDAVIDRLRSLAKGRGNQSRDGKQICIEVIQPLSEIEGVHGVRVMAYRQEE